jgi:hypothetical protein
MIDNRQAVDLLERAHDASPVCYCGRHTRLVGRAGGVWLECSSLEERPTGAISRVVAAITSGMHTNRLVLDLAPTAA